MAGDWIPMRTDLAEDPAVISIAAAVGLDECAVVGRLHKLWSWANRQLADGNAPGVTVSWVDRYLSADGFAAAMLAAGWLRATDRGIEIPHFERWNSKGAKTRALTARRVAAHKQKGNAEGNAPSVSDALPREEKRREEKKEEPPIPPADAGEVLAKPPRKKPREEHPLFAGFWSAYPRKTAKQDAARAFAKLDPDEALLGRMLAALAWQVKSEAWTKDGGKFVPYPATWLNGKRWEDEVPPVPAPTPDAPVLTLHEFTERAKEAERRKAG